MEQANLKFNWGAFFLPLQFGFANKAWKCFLTLIPFVGFIFLFVSGFSGAKWAYESGEFATVEEFNAVMKSWNRAGLLSLIATAISCVFSFVMAGAIIGTLTSLLNYY